MEDNISNGKLAKDKFCFSKLLKCVRDTLRLSQTLMAERIGITRARYALYEKGGHYPQDMTVFCKKIEELLKEHIPEKNRRRKLI